MHKNKKTILVWTVALGLAMLAGPVLAADITTTTDTTTTDTPVVDQSKILDKQDELKDDLKDAQKKADAIKGNLNQVNAALTEKQRAINSAAGLVANTEETIQRKTSEIDNLTKQVALHQELLRKLVLELYELKSVPLVEVMLDQNDLDSFMAQSDSVLTAQEKVGTLLDEIATTRERIKNDQTELSDAKQEQEDILREHKIEKQDIAEDKAELAAELDEQSKVIAKINKELAELQGDLQVVTGKSYSAGNIKEAVNFASGKTGVPKGFLYGMLKMETNLGRNVGGCTYAQVEDGAEKNYKNGNLSKRAYNTFIARRKTFKSITDGLGLDYRKQKVSCNPSGYAGTGGAMGVAQFMPDTWVGYKAEVARVTGHSKPSPWDLTDGVTAMALKLKRTPGVTSGNTSAMRSAACSYLGTCYGPYVNGILYWAKNYQQLL
jgi:peptidoglycan hydrolase CwlO-like protein